jgi:DNA invertase Pin-like site-specific DNA recombinase
VQRERIRAYAKLYDLTIVAWETDAASGKSLARPGLQSALRRIERGEVAGVLVAKLDRLTRSVRDLGALIAEHFGRDDGPALMSVAEQIDTRTAGGRLVLNVLGSVSQWERETIVERTTDALAMKRDRGERISRHAPYGYAFNANKVVPVEREQSTIAKAHALRERGLSLRAVAEQLASCGYVNRAGRAFDHKAVAAMLAG